ncbi:hypothetical protein BH23VER1_BH23VER1_09420 [soil metagenome]
MLVVMRAENRAVTRVSANCADFLGIEPEEVIGRSVESLFPPAIRPALSEFIAGIGRGFSNPFPVRLPLDRGGSASGRYAGIAHRSGGSILLELEAEGEELASGNAFPAGFGVMDLRLFHAIVDGARKAESISALCKIVCEVVAELTGFERVGVYRFGTDGGGILEADVAGQGALSQLGMPVFSGEVGGQPRPLGRLDGGVHLIVSSDRDPVPLVPADDPTSPLPLNLSRAVLRSGPSSYLGDLREMGVAASLSIPLEMGEREWGLIVCHDGRPRHVPHATRTGAAVLGSLVSAQLFLKEDALKGARRARLESDYRLIVGTVPKKRSLEQSLQERADALMELLSAGGLAFCFGGRVTTAGATPPEALIRQIERLIPPMSAEPVFVCGDILARLPDADDYGDITAGVLALEIGPSDHLIFFRGEMTPHDREVAPPVGKGVPEGGGRLGPRRSSPGGGGRVDRRSRPWDDEELRIAIALRGVLLGFAIHRRRDVQSLNRQIAAKSDEMESFVYSVSHDLKSPLVTCRGFIGLMLEDLEDGNLEAVVDSATRIDRAVTSMGRLIDALLDLSQIGAVGKTTRKVVDVQKIVSDALGLYEQRARERGAKIEMGQEMPPAMAHPVEVQRIFENLITNALKYGCPKPGHSIRVTGEAVGEGMVRYAVSDDGPGIPPEYHRKIFQLFQRLDTGQDGTGVGLATVAKVARVYGGDAWVESAPGEGSIFYFTLPAPAET